MFNKVSCPRRRLGHPRDHQDVDHAIVQQSKGVHNRYKLCRIQRKLKGWSGDQKFKSSDGEKERLRAKEFGWGPVYPTNEFSKDEKEGFSV